MLDGAGISDLFSRFGGSAKSKILVLGSPGISSETQLSPFRSLNIEHVSPAILMAQEISRRTPLGQKAGQLHRAGQPVPEETLFAVMRRWFWARKPDAGFVLTNFPATLLQAKVLDEWLDTRDEALNGVLFAGDVEPALVGHYRTLGLEPTELRAA